MNQEKRKKIIFYTDLFVLLGSLTLLLLLGYIFFLADDNICVELSIESNKYVDETDLGKKCFRTLAESNNYSTYLIDKYDIGREDPLFPYEKINLSIS